MSNIGIVKHTNGDLIVAVIEDSVCKLVNEIPEGNISYGGRPWLKKLRQMKAGQWRAVFKRLDLPKKPNKYFANHLCQAANAFQQSPYEESYVVVANAIGENEGLTVWMAWCDKEGNAQYKNILTKKYPYSLGLMYAAVTQYMGLTPNKDEGTVTAMSEKGIIDTRASWGITNKLWNGSFHKGCEDLREALFGLKKEDIAASVQFVLEKELKELHIPPRNVCFAGGVAYNRKALDVVFKQGVFVPKYPADQHSAAIGAAALLYKKKFKFD